MAGYKNKRGLIGTWDDLRVYIINKADYLELGSEMADDTVYVIADDKMRMVNKEYTIGYLQDDGKIIECNKTRYRPVKRLPRRDTVSTSGEDIELTAEVPNGYFESFATEVNEFFSHLQDPIIVSD